MQEDRNNAFMAWMSAEAAAHTAIHRLHQVTCGGRKAVMLCEIEAIRRLRKEAEVRFSALQAELGVPTAAAVAPVVSVAPARSRKEPALPAFATARGPSHAGAASSRAL